MGLFFISTNWSIWFFVKNHLQVAIVPFFFAPLVTTLQHWYGNYLTSCKLLLQKHLCIISQGPLWHTQVICLCIHQSPQLNPKMAAPAVSSQQFTWVESAWKGEAMFVVKLSDHHQLWWNVKLLRVWCSALWVRVPQLTTPEETLITDLSSAASLITLVRGVRLSSPVFLFVSFIIF